MHLRLVTTLIIFLFIFNFVFAGDCANPFFKSTACTDFNQYFDYNGFTTTIKYGTYTGAWTATGALDWNLQKRNDYVNSAVLGELVSDFNVGYDNLVALYHFNGDANDYSGKGNHGSVNGATYAQGLFGTQGVYFDGSTGYLSTNASADFALKESMSFSLWYKREVNSTSTSILFAIENAQTEAEIDNAIMYYYMTDSDLTTLSTLASLHEYGAGVNESLSYIPSILSTNGWHQITMVRNNSEKKFYAYFDGTLLSSGTYTNAPTIGAETTSKLFVGSRSSGLSKLKGYIDEVAVWNKALSSEEVLENYRRQKGDWLDRNLLVYLNFDNSVSTMVPDSARGNNGTMNNGASINAQGLLDTNALTLDGANDYVSIQPLPMDLNREVTVMMWINPTGITEYEFYFNDGNAYGSGIALTAKIQGSTPRYYVSLRTPTGANYVGLGDASSRLNFGQWQHVAFTFSVSNNESYLYVDGKRSSKTTPGGQISGLGGGTIRTILGCSYSYNACQIAKYDELKIYDRALTWSEILADYNRMLESKFVSDKNTILDGSVFKSWDSVKINENLDYDFGTEIENWAALEDKEIAAGGNGGRADYLYSNPNLKGLWNLNGNLVDSIGGRNGVWVGNESYATNDGLWGSSAALLNDYRIDTVTVTNAYFNSATALSAGIWFKNTGAGGDVWFPTEQAILYKTKDTTAGGWSLIYNTSTKTLVSTVMTSGGSRAICSPATIEPYRWNHAMLTWNGSQMALYINGRLIDVNATTGTSDFGTGVLSFGSAYGLMANARRYFTGQLDEVMYFDKALTSTEVEDIYYAGYSKFNDGLQGLWHLNGNANDSSGNGNDGTWNGSEDYINGLWGTNAGVFDGSTDYIDMGNDSSLDVNLFTASAWVKKADDLNGTFMVFSKGSNGDPANTNYQLAIADNYPRCFWEYGSGSDQTLVASNPIRGGQWYNIVCVYDGVNQLVYIDGALSNSSVASGTPATVTENLSIGKLLPGTSASEYFFNGAIEEVAIWGKALSSAEILDLYRKGVSRLDLNVYSCSDANCSTKTSTETLTNIQNNTVTALSSVSNSRYLGYEAYFRPITALADHNAGKFWAMSFFKNIEVETSIGNTPPTLSLNRIEGSSVSGSLPYYSDKNNGLLSLDLNVLDVDNDRLSIFIYTTTTLNQDSSGTLIYNADLNGLCDSNSWTTSTNCEIDLNSLLSSDGNYYIKAKLTDSVMDPVYSFTSILGIDNNAPSISATNSHSDWNRSTARITLSCSDSGSGCLTTKYRINNGSWLTYSSAITLTGDGNYQIDYNAIDNKGNYSAVQQTFALIGFNGDLRTYSDSNLPESYFGAGERVVFIYDVNLAYAPKITIKDSAGITQVNAVTMSNISQDEFFGASDLNTYYYEWDVNGSTGWVDVIIQNHAFPKNIYHSKTWATQYEDNNSQNFPLSFDLNVTEPGATNRWFYPVDTNVDFTYKADENSIRLLDYNGSAYKEIPFQLYDKNYSGELLANANIVFLTTIPISAEKNYFISYSIADYDLNYISDLNSTQKNFIFDFNNSSFFASIDINTGGLLKRIRSNIGSNTDLNGAAVMENAPKVGFGGTTFSANDVSDPEFEFESGKMLSKLTVRGTKIFSGVFEVFDYNIQYKFYSKAKFFLVDYNFITQTNSAGYDVYNSSQKIDSSKLDWISYRYGDLETTASAGTLLSGNDLNYYLAFDKNKANSFGEIFLTQEGSQQTEKSASSTNVFNILTVENKIVNSASLVIGDYFNSRKAVVIANPTKTNKDINELFLALTNELIITKGLTVTNDSANPSIVDANYSPDSNTTDQNSITCFSAWTDDTVLSRIDLNILGPNISVLYSKTINDQNGYLSYTIDANIVNAGTISCTATAYDLAGNFDSNELIINISDYSAPEFYSISSTPDSNSGVDPDMNLTIDANILEYSAIAVNGVTLYYRKYYNAEWSDWNSLTMDLNEQFFDYNYHYSSQIYVEEGTYEYYINAVDVNGYDANSEVYTIYAYTDYTWTLSPDSFGTKAGQLGTTITIGNLTIENTGDASINYRINSNWSNKYEIWYDFNYETASGVTFSVPAGSTKIIGVTLKTNSTSARSDSLQINITATTSSSSPSSDNTTATINSLSEEPFLYLEWVTTKSTATQGDTAVAYSAKITNVGSQTATDVNLDWNYPANWSISSGSELISISSLDSSVSLTDSISFNIATSAATGDQNIIFSASCCSDSNKTNTLSTLTTVLEQTSGGDSNPGTGNPGAGSPGGGGTGSSGGGLPFLSTAQKDLFFQTSESFELVRGQEDSFPVKFENPLNNSLKDIKFRVEGIMANYLVIGHNKIDLLEPGKEFDTWIEITSPKYFSPGRYEIKLIIDGVFVGDYNRETQFSEERFIILLMHDTNRETALEMIKEINLFIQEMQLNNYKLNSIPELVKDANLLFNEKDYDGVAQKYNLAKIIFDELMGSLQKSKSISGLVGLAESQGLSTPSTNRLLLLAQLAFQRGDYALALSRLKEAELTFYLETKGEFNLFVWVMGNLDRVALMLVLFIISAYMFYLGFTLLRVNSKLKELNSENSLLLNLIAGLQKRSFVENKISLGEYYDALGQFEKRIAEVSEKVIEFTSRKNNLFGFSSKNTRLNQEKKSLLELIKETQKQYFSMGLIETRIYQTRTNSLTKRLFEVDEAIVQNDLKKTMRLNNRGIKKYFWRIFYKFFK